MRAETALAVAAALRDLALALTVGSLVLVAVVLPAGHAAARRAVRVATWAAAAWTIAAAAVVVISYRVIALTPLSSDSFGPELWHYITHIPLGETQAQMVIAPAIASVVIAFTVKPAHAALALIPASFAIGFQAITGHAAGATDHHLAVSAMAMHLAGASVWLGALAALLLVRPRLGSIEAATARRVSRVLAWAVVLIVVSGIANAWLRLRSPADLATTTYGRLLALKILLMLAVVAAAAWHRRVGLPRLERDGKHPTFWRVIAADVVSLVAITVIAVALASTAPPVPSEAVANPTPAWFLTGYDLPPRLNAAAWVSQWRLEIIMAFVIVAAAVTYVRWVRRLRRRGDAWPWHRTALWFAGLAALAWVTQGAPSVYGVVSFSAHMVEHMALVMLVPLPLALGAPVTLALRAISPRDDGSRGPREWVRAIVESRLLKLLANPIVAAANFAGSLVIFYYSPLFEFALTNHAGHIWMVVHFTLVGYLFVNALVGVDPGPVRPRHPIRLTLLFATMGFHAFFGVTLMSSTVLLVPRWYGLMGRDWGPDAITDQQIGGQIAWGIGELPVIILALIVVATWRSADAREARRLDRRADRDHDADLDTYNAMLAAVAERDKTLPPGR